jgi:hypothetical protein
MVEEMTVVHEGWDAVYASDYTASAKDFGSTATASEFPAI